MELGARLLLRTDFRVYDRLGFKISQRTIDLRLTERFSAEIGALSCVVSVFQHFLDVTFYSYKGSPGKFQNLFYAPKLRDLRPPRFDQREITFFASFAFRRRANAVFA